MKYNKNPIEEAFQKMNGCDMGCRYLKRRGSNEIWLSSNYESGDIQLKVNKSGIRVYSGDRLTMNEKKLHWKFKNYETLDDMVQSISDFSYSYFTSFQIHRVVNGEIIL